MGVSYLEKKGGISLIIAIILAFAIFVVSWEFNERFGNLYEFLMLFFFMLFLLFYAIGGRGRRVHFVIWPVTIGVVYIIFYMAYGVVALGYDFSLNSFLADIAAIFLATLIYLLVIGHRKNVLWKGGNNEFHEEEIIKMAEEKELEKSLEDMEDIRHEELKKIKDSIHIEVEKKSDSVGKEKKTKKKQKKTEEKANKKIEEEESYFFLNNDNDFKKEPVKEKDLKEEVSEILDDFEDEEMFEDDKEDFSEGMSVDFERAIGEEEY